MDQPTQEQRDKWAKELREAYLAFFDTDHGKLVLADLMREFHIFTSTVTGEGDLGEVALLREGERKVVLYLLDRCGNAAFNPEFFVGMQRTYEQPDPLERLRR